MSNGLKIILGMCVACGLLMALPVGFAQESQLGEVSGEIVSVNTHDSSLIIKQIEDETSQSYSTQTFSVEKSASISKGNSVMILSNLKAGDKVTIAYTTTSEGVKVARTITVMEEDDNSGEQ
jgi:hypothetical protein